MSSSIEGTVGSSRAFTDDEDRWRAVLERNPAADGAFFLSVRTTGVYCRPTCPARRPLRRNVLFHATREEAEAAGFRPCKRCRPADPHEIVGRGARPESSSSGGR